MRQGLTSVMQRSSRAGYAVEKLRMWSDNRNKPQGLPNDVLLFGGHASTIARHFAANSLVFTHALKLNGAGAILGVSLPLTASRKRFAPSDLPSIPVKSAPWADVTRLKKQEMPDRPPQPLKREKTLRNSVTAKTVATK